MKFIINVLILVIIPSIVGTIIAYTTESALAVILCIYCALILTYFFAPNTRQVKGIFKTVNRQEKKMVEKILIIIVGLAMSITAFAGEEIKVNVSTFEPCVIQQKDGSLTGFDIELFDAICERMNVTAKYTVTPFENIFDTVTNKQTDMAMSGITINYEREKKVDFSHQYLDSGVAILARAKVEKTHMLKIIARKLFTMEMFQTQLVLIGSILVWGFLYWLRERGHSVDKKFTEGYDEACQAVFAIKTTVGWGKIVPETIIGRLMSIPIFFTGCVVVGMATAPIISAFTVREMDVIKSKITSGESLRGKTVVTQRGTTSVGILKRYGAKIIEVNSSDDMYPKLISGEVDAVVFDEPNLKYFLSKNPDKNLHIVGRKLSAETYGFAFPQGSPLREKINLILLQLKKDGTYGKIHTKWFGVAK